jgi:hypothetical protein
MSTVLTTRRLLPLLPLFAALACGKSDDGRNAFISAYCDAYSPCCLAVGLLFDPDRCRRFIGLQPPDAIFDKAAADDCLNGIKQATSDGQSCAGGFQEPVTCSQVFVSPAPTTPVGGVCTSDLECTPVPDAAVSCGASSPPDPKGNYVYHCQVDRRGQAGSSPCAATVKDGVWMSRTAPPATEAFLCYFEDGLRCNGTSCVPLGQVGDACATSADCAAPTFCDVNGLCTAPKAPGDACNGVSPVECQAGYYCQSIREICLPQVDLGAECDYDWACTSGICRGVCTTPPIGNLLSICQYPPY